MIQSIALEELKGPAIQLEGPCTYETNPFGFLCLVQVQLSHTLLHLRVLITVPVVNSFTQFVLVIKLTVSMVLAVILCQEREPQFLIMFKLGKFLIWLTNLVRDFPSLAQNSEKLSTCFSSHHPNGTIHNSVTFQRSGCLPIFWRMI